MIGIDIGNNNCKVALRDGSAMRLVSERMPDNLVHAGSTTGEVTAPNTMIDFLKSVRKSERIHDRNCTFVLASGQVYFRHVSLPPMNTSELMLNLPYEFRDFISDDPETYVYDYSVDGFELGAEGEIERMELYACAVPKRTIDAFAGPLKKAGFKLRAVVPAQMAYRQLVASHLSRCPEDAERDMVLVDIGHSDVTVMLFSGSRYDSERVIDFGCDEFDRIIADLKGIDPYTANSYKMANFENVMQEPECLALCDRFALEVSKVVNFYNFNNPEREIGCLYFLGGGAHLSQLTNAISQAVSVRCADAVELLPPEARDQDNASVCALAVAGLLEGESI